MPRSGPLAPPRRNRDQPGVAPRWEAHALRIWIDANAESAEVKELVLGASKHLDLEVIVAANQRLQTPPGNLLVSAIRVDGGADVADRYIAEHVVARTFMSRWRSPGLYAIIAMSPEGAEQCDSFLPAWLRWV